jgi:hypothetical protein
VTVALSVASVASFVACKAYDPLYCNLNKPCSDPERPFCDLNGEYEASEGIARTCIPDPGTDEDAGTEDSGTGSPDAGLCAPGEFIQCTDVNIAVYCNENGSELVTLECDSECDPDNQGCFCGPETSSCSNNQTIHCRGDGSVEEIESCPLGCNDTGERCVDVNPSNGLAGYLDMTDSAPIVVLSSGAIIDTDAGTIENGDGTMIDVPAFQLSAPPGGVTVRVFAVKSLTIADALITGERALAIVSDGDILIGGHVRILAGASDEGTCVGGAVAVDGCDFLCAAVSGAGGGGFGGSGGPGGDATAREHSAVGGAAGAIAGNASLIPLLGGCAGGGNEQFEGGSAGGALQLVSRTLIQLQDGPGQAHLNAGGRGGNPAFGANFGGGSGGGILLEAPRVVLSSGTSMVANGGGGASYCPGNAEDGSLSGTPAQGGGVGCDDFEYGPGGKGGARLFAATAGVSVSHNVPGAAWAGGGGGGVGRVRVNVPVEGDFVGSTGVSPSPSVGSLATR